MKWIGSPVAEIWPFAYVEGIWNPHFWGSTYGCYNSIDMQPNNTNWKTLIITGVTFYITIYELY